MLTDEMIEQMEAEDTLAYYLLLINKLEDQAIEMWSKFDEVKEILPELKELKTAAHTVYIAARHLSDEYKRLYWESDDE